MIENLIFSQLLKNDSFARAVLPHLKEEYFTDQAEKNFLKIYNHFFQKHNVIPSKQALLVEIEKLKASAEIYKSMQTIVNRTEEFTETLPWLIESTEKFCREKAIFNALRESILIVDGQSKTKTADAIPSILQDALSVCFDTTVGHDYVDDAEARYEYYHTTENRIPTGMTEFDTLTKGGFPRKTLNLYLAPPHGGKSLVMVNVAAGAMLAGYNVLYISMEMAAEEIGKRFDVNLMDIDFDTLALLPKATFQSKFSKIAEKSRGKLKIREYPTSTAHAGHFRSLLEELKSKQNFIPDMIVVDYLGICLSENYKSSSGANSYTIMKSVGEELRALAITHDCAIVSAIQTNRSGVGSSSLDMNNIAESLGSAMTADFIAAVITTDELKDLKQVMFQLIKNRYGGIIDYAKFMMGIDYKKMKLFELENSQFSIPLNNKKKQPKIETANDTFIDMSHQIKPTVKTFDDFNF